MRSAIQKARIIFSRLNRLSFAFACALAFISCIQGPNGETVPPNGSILFPLSGSVQQYGERTLLRSDGIMCWYSSLDGFLGCDTSLSVILSRGTHEITIVKNEAVQDIISIAISSPADTEEFCLELQGSDPRLVVPAGAYDPVYITGSGYSTKVRMTIDDFLPAAAISFSALTPVMAVRDIPLWSAYQRGWKKIETRQDRTVLGAPDAIEKIFHLVPLGAVPSGGDSGIHAKKMWASAGVDIWVDSNAHIDTPTLETIGAVLENNLIAQHLSVWGIWNDIDGNGKMSVLFTPVFNQGRIAIGLFNPADFYAFCDNPESPSYNPYSNQMDIIYAGCPDHSGMDPSFSPESILATVAHELQHLTSFSVICEQQKRFNLKDPLLEDVFLEEGLSHLAESLSGYGVSGGNIAFVARYLQSTYKTPLGQYSEEGYGDSVERRGGMALLLSWLYEKACSNAEDGGNAFLQEIYNSRKRGWLRLEEVTGFSQRQILKQFADFLSHDTDMRVRIDPVTLEPISVDPFAVAFAQPLEILAESSVTLARESGTCAVTMYLRKK